MEVDCFYGVGTVLCISRLDRYTDVPEPDMAQWLTLFNIFILSIPSSPHDLIHRIRTSTSWHFLYVGTYPDRLLSFVVLAQV